MSAHSESWLTVICVRIWYKKKAAISQTVVMCTIQSQDTMVLHEYDTGSLHRIPRCSKGEPRQTCLFLFY